MSSTSADQRTAKGMVWSLARTFGRRGVSTISFLILASLLIPEDFGIVAYAGVFVVGIQVVMDLGLSDAIVQREDLRDGHLHTAFWLSIGVGLAFFGLFQFGAGPLAELLDEPRLAPILRWLSIVFVLGGVSVVPQALLQRELAFRQLAVREFAAVLAGGVVGIVFAVRNAGAWSLVAQQLAWAGILIIALWVMTPYRPRFRFQISDAIDLLRFGVHRIGFKGLRFVNQNADDFLIGLILGPVALGYYTVAYRVINIASDAFVEAVNAVAFPALARMTTNAELFRSKVTKGIGVLVLAAFPAFLGLLVVAGLVVGVFLKPEWAPTVPVLQGLAVMGIALSVASFSRSAILSYGRAGVTLGLQAVATAASLTAILAAVRHGVEWVGVALAIQALVLLPVELTALRRTTPVRLGPYLGQIVGPLAAALTMCGAAALVVGATRAVADPARLGLAVAIGGVVYVIVLRWLAQEQLARALRGVRLALGR